MAASGFAQQLDALEEFHGRQRPGWPLEPYEFLIWWQCGYPPSEAACAKGFESLKGSVGVRPDRLLHCKRAALTRALKPGGLVAPLRAQRLQEIAATMVESGGDLRRTLRELPIAAARKLLKEFPGIGNPGADRILLFANIAPLAAVPSNAPQVAVRMQVGTAQRDYAQEYRAAQEIVESQVPAAFAQRQRAYLILKYHGEKLCKRTKPDCERCPIIKRCAYGSKSNRLVRSRAARPALQ